MRQEIKILIIAALYGILIVLSMTFFNAYLHGYQTLIKINDYHEAWIEALLLPSLLILGAWLFIHECKILREVKS